MTTTQPRPVAVFDGYDGNTCAPLFRVLDRDALRAGANLYAAPVAQAAPVTAAVPAELTDAQIEAIWTRLDGDKNWLRTFGYRQFARAVLEAAEAVALPAGWREFIENIATPYSEPLNSVCAYRDKASRQDAMVELRQKAEELLAAAPAAPTAAAVPESQPAAVTSTSLPDIRDYLGHVVQTGEAITLSSESAAALFHAMTTGVPQGAAPAAPVPAASEGWTVAAGEMPEGNVLASMLYPNGKRRTIVAFYAKRFTIISGCDDGIAFEVNEEDDEYYLREGWYECIQNWDEYSSITVNEGTVTHWMPLPAAPSTDQQEG